MDYSGASIEQSVVPHEFPARFHNELLPNIGIVSRCGGGLNFDSMNVKITESLDFKNWSNLCLSLY